ncbi:MAG: hypothetical protein H7Y15_12640 [Pseudonocardia sp.]|nr:hypothetical protein [Pseudonocardia sp.]
MTTDGHGLRATRTVDTGAVTTDWTRRRVLWVRARRTGIFVIMFSTPFEGLVAACR